MPKSPPTIEYTSARIEQSIAAGEVIGRHVPIGAVIALDGPLGAGKTHLTKGIARGLGFKDWQRVNSPTFTLLSVYRGGRAPLYHMDFYRIEGAATIPPEIVEVIENRDGVCVIEWAGRFPEVLTAHTPRLDVTLEDLGGDERRLTLRVTGFDAQELQRALQKTQDQSCC